MLEETKVRLTDGPSRHVRAALMQLLALLAAVDDPTVPGSLDPVLDRDNRRSRLAICLRRADYIGVVLLGNRIKRMSWIGTAQLLLWLLLFSWLWW